MIHRIHRDEAGMSLTEVMVAGILSSLVLAAFYAVFFAFNRNVYLEEQRAETLQDVRPVVAEMVVQLRQAQDVLGLNATIQQLDSSWGNARVSFFSDRRADVDGPEWYRYRLANCVGSVCDLVQDFLAADTGSGPNWTYSGAPTSKTLLENVRTDGAEPLFQGVSWVGGVEQFTNSCGPVTPRCDFELVRIRLRVDPDPSNTVLPVVEIQEDVRLRNA